MKRKPPAKKRTLPSIDKAEMKAWMRRWKLVNEITIREARGLSPEQRLHELDSLFRSRGLFRWPTEEEAGVPAVRRRWLRLKKSGRG